MEINHLREKLVDTMSPTSARTLRATLLAPKDLIRFFSTPRSEVASSSAFAKIAFAEHRGLDSLHVLALTSETPTQLANSMGAIAAASNARHLADTLDKNPFDLSPIKNKSNTAVKDLNSALTETPRASFSAEDSVSQMRGKVAQIGQARVKEIIDEVTAKVRAGDKTFYSILTEVYFLNAFDHDDIKLGSSGMKNLLSTLFLGSAGEIFMAVEKLLVSQPNSELFDLVYGRQASFWREFRHDLLPNFNKIAEQIIQERQTKTSDQQVIDTVGNLHQVGMATIEAKEIREKAEQQRRAEELRKQAERDRIAKEQAEKIRQENERKKQEEAQKRAEAERVAQEQREREQQAEAQKKAEEQKAAHEKATNPEKFAWNQATAFYQKEWESLVPKYDPGFLEEPLKPKARIPLFIDGVDIIHKAIFGGKSDSEIRAALEVILPKVWSLKELNFAFERDKFERTDPKFVLGKLEDHFERIFAQVIYLPKDLRPHLLGRELAPTPEIRAAKNVIVQKLSVASHPDKKYQFSDPSTVAAILDFYKTSTRVKRSVG